MSSAAAPAASPLSIKASPRPGSRVALEVAIPGGRSQASYDAAVDKLSRSIKLPGFRKGKVPRPVLLQQIGPLRIRATALEDLVDAAIHVDAAEAEHRYIAAGGGAAFYGHQGGQLLARLLDQFIYAGWIEADCLGLSL